ncbi:MAG: hypothetical protein OXJ52_06505 [Oligoflexia bacterium]|nr:hypothetical protein [Oligoflexia bacterium]
MLVFFQFTWFELDSKNKISANKMAYAKLKIKTQSPILIAKFERSIARNFFDDKGLKKATQLLKSRQKILDGKTFPYILDKNVCQVLDKIKQTSSLSEEHKKDFFTEVIKTYGLVLDYSLDHNYFYCLYHYFNSPKPKFALDLANKFLSQNKVEELLDRLETCHEEEVRGNGDDPQANLKKETLSVKKTQSQELLSLKDYKSLSFFDRLSYSQALRKAYLVLEADKISNSISNNWFDIFLPIVRAQNKRKCVVGGVLREVVYSHHLGRSVCPVRNNTCDEKKNTFKCGSLFNSACISIHPIKNLSKRCYQKAQSAPISEDDYNEFINNTNKAYKDYCLEREKRRGKAVAGCNFYTQRVDELKAVFSNKVRSMEEKIEQKTEASFNTGSQDCEECRAEGDKNQQVNGISEIMKLVRKSEDSDLVKYLSKQAYDNSACKCGGNDACTRGCKKRGKWPPHLKCRGNKSKNKSTKFCMRHVNGILTDTINTFFGRYCEDNYPFDREKCLDIHKKNLKEQTNICTKSFVFPSALCALNLDGKDRYQSIKNKRIKRKCEKFEYRYNHNIKTIKLISDDGKRIEETPLFEEITMPEDPNDLPTGAIVVMKSGSKHGHIEIKTDKQECNGSYCFCSDYCASRSGGYTPPFKPVAVFRWNPKVLEYLGDM